MAVTFWLLAPLVVLAALGILFVRKAVHAALLLAVVMIGLSILYLVQDAPFLFAVQIIVYTGAILMLFLFVVMLVGVDASDSLVETIRGQRLWAVIAGLAFGLLLVAIAVIWIMVRRGDDVVSTDAEGRFRLPPPASPVTGQVQVDPRSLPAGWVETGTPTAADPARRTNRPTTSPNRSDSCLPAPAPSCSPSWRWPWWR